MSKKQKCKLNPEVELHGTLIINIEIGVNGEVMSEIKANKINPMIALEILEGMHRELSEKIKNDDIEITIAD